MVGAVASAGFAAGQQDQPGSTELARGGTSTEIADGAPTSCFDTGAVVAQGEIVAGDMTNASNAFSNLDPAGAAMYLHQAARSTQRLAVLSAADPNIATEISLSADELEAASLDMDRASALMDGGDNVGATSAVESATSHMYSGTAHIETATAGISQSSVPAC